MSALILTNEKVKSLKMIKFNFKINRIRLYIKRIFKQKNANIYYPEDKQISCLGKKNQIKGTITPQNIFFRITIWNWLWLKRLNFWNFKNIHT